MGAAPHQRLQRARIEDGDRRREFAYSSEVGIQPPISG